MHLCMYFYIQKSVNNFVYEFLFTGIFVHLCVCMVHQCKCNLHKKHHKSCCIFQIFGRHIIALCIEQTETSCFAENISLG